MSRQVDPTLSKAYGEMQGELARKGGNISENEAIEAVKQILDDRDKAAAAKKTSFRYMLAGVGALAFALIFSCIMMFVVYEANEATKDTTVDPVTHTLMTKRTHVPVKTEMVKCYTNLLDLPRLPVKALNEVTELIFSTEDGRGHSLGINGFNIAPSSQGLPTVEVYVANPLPARVLINPNTGTAKLVDSTGEYNAILPNTGARRALMSGHESRCSSDGLCFYTKDEVAQMHGHMEIPGRSLQLDTTPDVIAVVEVELDCSEATAQSSSRKYAHSIVKEIDAAQLVTVADKACDQNDESCFNDYGLVYNIAFDHLEACERYGLDRCNSAASSTMDHDYKPYPGTRNVNGKWYFNDKFTYSTDGKTHMAKMTMGHDPQGSARHHVIMQSADGSKYLEYDLVEEEVEVITDGEEDSEFKTVAHMTNCKVNQPAVNVDMSWAPTNLDGRSLSQETIEHQRRLKSEANFHAQINRFVKGFNGMHIRHAMEPVQTGRKLSNTEMTASSNPFIEMPASMSVRGAAHGIKKYQNCNNAKALSSDIDLSFYGEQCDKMFLHTQEPVYAADATYPNTLIHAVSVNVDDNATIAWPDQSCVSIQGFKDIPERADLDTIVYGKHLGNNRRQLSETHDAHKFSAQTIAAAKSFEAPAWVAKRSLDAKCSSEQNQCTRKGATVCCDGTCNTITADRVLPFNPVGGNTKVEDASAACKSFNHEYTSFLGEVNTYGHYSLAKLADGSEKVLKGFKVAKAIEEDFEHMLERINNAMPSLMALDNFPGMPGVNMQMVKRELLLAKVQLLEPHLEKAKAFNAEIATAILPYLTNTEQCSASQMESITSMQCANNRHLDTAVQTLKWTSDESIFDVCCGTGLIETATCMMQQLQLVKKVAHIGIGFPTAEAKSDNTCTVNAAFLKKHSDAVDAAMREVDAAADQMESLAEQLSALTCAYEGKVYTEAKETLKQLEEKSNVLLGHMDTKTCVNVDVPKMVPVETTTTVKYPCGVTMCETETECGLKCSGCSGCTFQGCSGCSGCEPRMCTISSPCGPKMCSKEEKVTLMVPSTESQRMCYSVAEASNNQVAIFAAADKQIDAKIVDSLPEWTMFDAELPAFPQMPTITKRMIPDFEEVMTTIKSVLSPEQMLGCTSDASELATLMSANQLEGKCAF